MTDNYEAWTVAIVMVAPVVVVWAWEMVRAIRERITARRIIRETWGDGTP